MAKIDFEGFGVHTGVFPDDELQSMRDEADQLQQKFGSACLRGLRAKSDLFHNLAHDQRLQSLIPPGLVPVRSILFDKTSAENWPVAWHQDLTISVAETREIDGYGPWSIKDGVPHVQPPVSFLQSMTTLRIHLDTTTADNGALRVIPKSHRLGRLDRHQIRSLVSEGEVTCECVPGDVLRMSPLILHASSRSAVPRRRRIIHIEFAPANLLNQALEFHES